MDWDRGERLVLGLEGGWGRGRADLREASGSTAAATLSNPATAGPLRTSGVQLQATPGWRL